jgi:hypothetical protein
VTQATEPAQPAEPAAPAGPIERDRTRPVGIVLLVLFQVLNVSANLLALAGVLGPRRGSLVGVLGNDVAVLDYLLIGLAVLSLAGAVALWRLDKFGWYAIMLLTGLGLALQIAFYVWATPNFINLAIFVISAFYLNQHEVKSLFLVPPVEAQSVVLSVEEDDR